MSLNFFFQDFFFCIVRFIFVFFTALVFLLLSFNWNLLNRIMLQLTFTPFLYIFCQIQIVLFYSDVSLFYIRKEQILFLFMMNGLVIPRTFRFLEIDLEESSKNILPAVVSKFIHFFIQIIVNNFHSSKFNPLY